VRERCFLPGGTFIPFPEETRGLTLWRRFADVADRFPHRPALVEEYKTLEYRELATAADRVAASLDACAREAHGPVGILLEAGSHAFAAMLGSLELGADTNRTLYIEDILRHAEPHAGEAAVQSSDALALYTSGSTGKPKGFTQTHRNLLHDVMLYTNAAHYCAEDRFLLISSVSFAGSLRTIYGALLNGACLYPYALRERGLLELEAWILEHELTIYRSVPTLFRQFVSELGPANRFPALRLIYLAGEPVYRSDFEYWREQLSGIQALELSTDYPRPSVSTSQGGRIERSLPADLSAKLKAVAGEHRVTLFIFLLAAFQVLLFRHSGTADVAVGVPITNRVRREWQSLIGLFVNTLVLRSRLRREECFSELLRRTGQMAINAYSHADLPFEKLVEEFAPQRDTSSNPLFQAMLSFQHRAPALSGFTGLDIEEIVVDNGVAKFDLALNIRDRGPDLQLSLIYRSDLFESGSMERLLRHFEILLRSIAVNPDTRVDALEILPDSERNQLMVGWNPAPGKPFAPQCVHDLFEQWARQTPDAVALRTINGDVGYRDLCSRASGLALHLQQRGVVPGAAVGPGLKH
jgi:non-ribosomal peptide synthetase component F